MSTWSIDDYLISHRSDIVDIRVRGAASITMSKTSWGRKTVRANSSIGNPTV